MTESQKQSLSRVAVVDSEKTWDTLMSKAKLQGSPVVVHFAASWCIPSVAMKPFFEEQAMKNQDILFLMVDVDAVKDVASKMNVKAMPTFLLMKEGVVVDKLIGANPEEVQKRVQGLIS